MSDKCQENLKLGPVYLDYNATTPLAPEVIKEISEALENAWGNPSSAHELGKKAKYIIDSSRAKVSGMIGASPQDIIFMSGGTEANNVALHSGVQEALQNSSAEVGLGLPHVITSNVEHDSVIRVLRNWEASRKIHLSVAAVDKDTGCLSLEKIIELIKPETCLISVMHANNETGIIMPIGQIGSYLESIRSDRETCRCHKIYFHCDAAQTIGKIPVDVGDLKVDYLTVVGHKFYGPRIGALFAKDLGVKTPVYPLVHGGGQENGFRPGTENTPMIAGIGAAAGLVSANISEYNANMVKSRDHFSNSLHSAEIGFLVNFQIGGRLPNTVSLSVPESLLASKVLEKCDGQIFASLGAACHSGTGLPSAILIASGLSTDEARRVIRFSMGRETTLEQVDYTVNIILDACHQLLASG